MCSSDLWSENEELVALRKEHAYRLASYAETRGFIEGPPELETEDEAEVGFDDEGSEVEEEFEEITEAETTTTEVTPE